MKKSILTAIMTLLLLILSKGIQGQSANQAEVIKNTHKHLIDSEYVDQTYTIQVGLPYSYDKKERDYPVLYVLDADLSFGLATDVSRWLAWSGQNKVPETIVVGISYGKSLGDWWQKRSRDYTPTKDSSGIWGEWPIAGGAGDFTQFVKKELMPYIEENYKADPNNRILSGLSFGGLYANYMLFASPDLFNHYILVGPAIPWNNNWLMDHEERYFREHQELNAIVYTAIGEFDDPYIMSAWHEFNARINERKYQGLIWHTKVFPGENHISVFPSALTHGLRMVFK